MTRIGFLTMLSPSEKKALRILAAIENKSMGEFTRETIRDLWTKYYPQYALGEIPTDKDNPDKHTHAREKNFEK